MITFWIWTMYNAKKQIKFVKAKANAVQKPFRSIPKKQIPRITSYLQISISGRGSAVGTPGSHFKLQTQTRSGTGTRNKTRTLGLSAGLSTDANFRYPCPPLLYPYPSVSALKFWINIRIRGYPSADIRQKFKQKFMIVLKPWFFKYIIFSNLLDT